jgi:putative membrane protein
VIYFHYGDKGIMHWGWDHYPWGWSTMVIMAFFLVLLIVGIAYLVRNLGSGKSLKEDTALDILKKRYASGEISREEFEDMKKNIR